MQLDLKYKIGDFIIYLNKLFYIYKISSEDAYYAEFIIDKESYGARMSAKGLFSSRFWGGYPHFLRDTDPKHTIKMVDITKYKEYNELLYSQDDDSRYLAEQIIINNELNENKNILV